MGKMGKKEEEENGHTIDTVFDCLCTTVWIALMQTHSSTFCLSQLAIKCAPKPCSKESSTLQRESNGSYNTHWMRTKQYHHWQTGKMTPLQYWRERDAKEWGPLKAVHCLVTVLKWKLPHDVAHIPTLHYLHCMGEFSLNLPVVGSLS